MFNPATHNTAINLHFQWLQDQQFFALMLWLGIILLCSANLLGCTCTILRHLRGPLLLLLCKGPATGHQLLQCKTLHFLPVGGGERVRM
jgi:hypothetical protein